MPEDLGVACLEEDHVAPPYLAWCVWSDNRAGRTSRRRRTGNLSFWSSRWRAT